MEPLGCKDVWSAGDLYEPYVGRCSRRVAKKFIKWMAVLERKDWLDVGCGTGALTEAIFECANPKSVNGIDATSEYASVCQGTH